MKRKEIDPLDTYYHYPTILKMFTQIDESNIDMLDKVHTEIQEYLNFCKNQTDFGEIKALGLKMRLEDDLEFRKQMIEATLQHNAIISTFVMDKDIFFNDFLYPKIKELSKYDYVDTRHYRLTRLNNFNFSQLIEEGLDLNDEIIEKGLSRVKEVQTYLKENYHE